MKTFRSLAIALWLTVCAGGAQAALHARPGGMVYDDVFNITWLADMNYAYTSGYSTTNVYLGGLYSAEAVWANGAMGWNAAKIWAETLSYAGYEDWRLPNINPYDTSCSDSILLVGYGLPTEYYKYSCRGSELSHLFVEDFGNKADESVFDSTGDTPTHLANRLLFSNVQLTGYWSSTESLPFPSSAWAFASGIGMTTYYGKNGPSYAVAVRDGDVLPVPALAPHILDILGLAFLVRLRKQTNQQVLCTANSSKPHPSLIQL